MERVLALFVVLCGLAILLMAGVALAWTYIALKLSEVL